LAGLLSDDTCHTASQGPGSAVDSRLNPLPGVTGGHVGFLGLLGSSVVSLGVYRVVMLTV